MKSTYYLVITLMLATFIPVHSACEKERIALRASGGSDALKAAALDRCAQNHCNGILHRGARIAACKLKVPENIKRDCEWNKFEKCMQDTRTGR